MSGFNPYAEAYKFTQWAKRNPDAMRALHGKARELARKKGYVSANYLLNWLRNDTLIRIDGLESHEFKTPNHFAPLLGRYLRQDPAIAPFIVCHQSKFDEVLLPKLEY